MCGICGVMAFGNSGFQVNQQTLHQMNQAQFHRGPDGGNLWISKDQKIGFGHRRLSILDLTENAAQPMTNGDQSVVLSYNGEIYNFMEIRQQLDQEFKIQWKADHSDTEVLLQAYLKWGLDSTLTRIRGMFAFAIWDQNINRLFLVRDRIGVKPLYYSNYKGRLAFASEIKALLVDAEIKRDVDTEAMFHYLSFLSTPAPQTLFAGIKKLEAGTYLTVDPSGGIKRTEYWDVWDHVDKNRFKSEPEILEAIRAELTEAVKMRKIADVPVGVFLSGGIDSSTNAALFSEMGQKPIKTFSIGYEGNHQTYQNELHYARKMAKTINSEHYELLLNEDHLFTFLPEMIHLQDEPISDPVCLPVYYVSKLARDNGVTVCQVGEGADELYWGYETWKLHYKLNKLNNYPIPTLFKKGLMGLYKTMGKQHSPAVEALRRSIAGVPIFWGGADSFFDLEKHELLHSSLKNQFKGFTTWEALNPIYQNLRQKSPQSGYLDWMSYVDLKHRLPELLLMRVDKMSMGVSLEARVPFLDHKFVELSLSIPESFKTKNNISKYALKSAVRGLIPDELIDRKKQGFGVPVYEWYFGKLGQKSRKCLLQFCDETAYLDKKAVTQILDSNNGPKAWYLLNFALWWHHTIKQEDLHRVLDLKEEKIPFLQTKQIPLFA